MFYIMFIYLSPSLCSCLATTFSLGTDFMCNCYVITYWILFYIFYIIMYWILFYHLSYKVTDYGCKICTFNNLVTRCAPHKSVEDDSFMMAEKLNRNM
jgi:hypothetical protein